MIFIILFIYWILSTLFVGLGCVSEKDSLEVGIIVGCISVLFGWLILPVACVLYVYDLLKRR